MRSVNVTRFVLLGSLFLTTTALGAMQVPQPAHPALSTTIAELSLPPLETGALTLAIQQGRAVDPQVAVARPAAFWGGAQFPSFISGFEDYPSLERFLPSYHIQARGNAVPLDRRGTYCVRGADGAVTEVTLEPLESENVPYVEDVSSVLPGTALATAQSFLAEHYPEFGQHQWQLWSERWWGEQEWDFRWYRIVDAQWSTRAGDYVGIRVNRISGRVVQFGLPDDAVTGPTAPVVTQAEAALLAQQVCPLPPAQHPFIESWLEMAGSGDEQYPEWVFVQQTVGEDPELHITEVNALTGEAYTAPALGGELPGRPRLKIRRPRLPRRFRWPRPVVQKVRVRSQSGAVVSSPVYPPQVRVGRVWARVESFQRLGAHLQQREDGFRLFFGPRLRADGPELGARRCDHGWWVPVRETAQRFGWPVRWDRVRREVVVDSGLATRKM